jgi:hypothetical protein
MPRADNYYIVAASPDGWRVLYNGVGFGPFIDRTLALYAAIDAAWRTGQCGESAEVFAAEPDGALTSLWLFGRDPYPRAHGAAAVFADAAD